MELDMIMQQSHILSVQQIQSMKILQMNLQELFEHINESAVENPLLVAEKNFKEEEHQVLLQKLKWIESEDTQNRHYYKMDKEDQRDALQNVASTVKEGS